MTEAPIGQQPARLPLHLVGSQKGIMFVSHQELSTQAGLVNLAKGRYSSLTGW